MKRRHWLALCGSVALAGCSGDPTNILDDNSSDPNTSDSESTEDPSQNTSDSEPTEEFSPYPLETTFEGSGNGFREITIEHRGPTIFEVDAPAQAEVDLVRSDSRRPVGLSEFYTSQLTTTIVATERRTYAIEIEAEPDLSWSVTVEDHSRYLPAAVGDPEFPIEFTGEGEDVFGPFALDGFYQPRIRTNVETEVIFVDNEGGLLHSFDSEPSDSFIRANPVNIDQVCWINCRPDPDRTTERAIESGDIESISYEIQVPEPNRG